MVGQVLPDDLKDMDFALTALFVVLAWEAFKNNKDYSLPLFAVVLALVSGFVAPEQMLVIALTTYFAILLLRVRFPNLDKKLELRTSHE